MNNYILQSPKCNNSFCAGTKAKSMDVSKAREMVKSIFDEKLKEKEDEVDLISQRIKEVQNALQLVRYGSVTSMSNQTQIYVRKFFKIVLSKKVVKMRRFLNYSAVIHFDLTRKFSFFFRDLRVTISCLRFTPQLQH